MARMRSFGLGLIGVTVVALLAPTGARAQGCTGATLSTPGGAYDTEGVSYFLQKGKWRASFGFEGFRSHRHFVGDVEQNAANVANGTAERDRSGNEVINHSYISNFNASYGVSDRLTLTAELPYVVYMRVSPARGDRPLGRTRSHGIGDLRLTGYYWLRDPASHGDGNIQVGFGIKVPTGNNHVEDNFVTVLSDGSIGYQRRPVDFSIMPGDGGWGFITSVQAFKALGRVTAFASGTYLFNPQEQMDYLRNPFATNPDPSSAYYSISDQYAARVGLSTAVKKVGLSLAARLEGVPASDIIGGDLGRRRPGYSVAIEPGISYSLPGGNAFSLRVPILVRRDRTQNISDKIATQETGVFHNGDAAFADYIILGGFTHTF